MIVYIIAALLVFGVLIAVHELGHFLAAKACGVRVNEFAIGMGPKIFGWRRGGTDYSIRALPVGGFLTLGCLIAVMQWALAKSEKKKEAK